MRRKTPLVTDHIYHVFNKSIHGYTIFNSPQEYNRMLESIQFYQHVRPPTSLCVFQRYHRKDHTFSEALKEYYKTYSIEKIAPLVKILAFCLMPTHLHLQVQQLHPEGICLFMQRVQNSYAQFFNNRHNRKGPLWQSRFGNTLIDDDTGLLRNSLYIHANPVKNLKIASAGQWPYSSYKDYIGESLHPFCDPSPLKNIFSTSYAEHMAQYLTTPPPGSGAVEG